MSCEHYQEALSEAAATAGEPQGQLRAHLESCAPCRAALAAEQSLFDSIDMGLQIKANAEVPSTLLPRVRAGLSEANSPARSSMNTQFLVASAATLAFLFLTTQILRHPNAVRQTGSTAADHLPAEAPRPQGPNPISASPPNKHYIALPHVTTVGNLVAQDSLSPRSLEPEVLVPRDQESLLASYQEHWQSRKRAPLIAANPDPASLTPLELVPIQIAELDVKLMAEQQVR